MNDRKVKWIFIGLPVLLLVLIAVALGIYRLKTSEPNLPVFGDVTPFEFTERNGDKFGSQEMSGKIGIVNFFFTSCAGPCPVMNAKMAELYRKFSNAPEVQFISISVDPERDTLEALQQYALKFGVNDRRWVFLRAPIRDVQDLSEKVFWVAGGELPNLHSTKLVLIDDRLKIRGYYSSEDPESVHLLANHIGNLIKKKK